MEKKKNHNRIHEYHSLNRFEMFEIHGTNVKNGNDDRVSSKRMLQTAHFHFTTSRKYKEDRTHKEIISYSLCYIMIFKVNI